MHDQFDVTLEDHAVIHYSCNFINHLWCCERGVGTERHTKNQHSPVLHTLSIIGSALRDCLSNITTSECTLIRDDTLTQHLAGSQAII